MHVVRAMSSSGHPKTCRRPHAQVERWSSSRWGPSMPLGDKGSGLGDKGSCSVYKSDYSYSTREPVGCLRDCRCIAVRLALACGMVRAAAVYDVLASIRSRPAQFNTNNVLRTKAASAIVGSQGQFGPGCLPAAAWAAGLAAAWQQHAA